LIWDWIQSKDIWQETI
jgi:predicted transcriptional regulator